MVEPLRPLPSATHLEALGADAGVAFKPLGFDSGDAGGIGASPEQSQQFFKFEPVAAGGDVDAAVGLVADVAAQMQASGGLAHEGSKEDPLHMPAHSGA